MRSLLLHGGAMADWNRNCRSIGYYNYTVAFPTPRTLSFQRFKLEFQLLSEKKLNCSSGWCNPFKYSKLKHNACQKRWLYSRCLSEQWSATQFETVARRKKVESRPTVIKISRSRALFEALKMLRFNKYICKLKVFCKIRKFTKLHDNIV